MRQPVRIGALKAPPARRAKSHLRIIGGISIAIGGAAATAVGGAWSMVASTASVSQPTFATASLVAPPRTRPVAVAPAPAPTVSDIRNFRSSGAIAAAPGWLFDPAAERLTALTDQTPATIAVTPVPLPRPAELAEAASASVPLPIANPRLADRAQGAGASARLAFADSTEQLALPPVPPKNPLLADKGQPTEKSPPAEKEQLAELTPADRPVNPEPAPSGEVSIPGPYDTFAVYDIKAGTVYMPNGARLEAHSGLGGMFDDPRHISVKMRGPTPPNTYDLRLRESLFHGVEALRMTPVGDRNMYGRDGILAHSYMLGPRGDSNGCVSFKEYDKFLAAYKRGKVTRLVVVESLQNAPARTNPLLAWLKPRA